MGLLFGLPNQLVLLAIAAGLTAMVVFGYLMWWKRRPTRGSNWAFGRPAPAGTPWQARKRIMELTPTTARATDMPPAEAHLLARLVGPCPAVAAVHRWTPWQ